MPAPPLAYSLPGFYSGAYRDHRRHIDDVRSLGFRWVTFTPTYLVHDELPMRIAPDRGPGFDELRAAIEYAVECGLSVKLEPHLDWETTLTGGPYEWRRRMYFAPDGYYGAQILVPLARLLGAMQGAQFALTLGSELDVSLVEFSANWRTVLADLRRIAGNGCLMGHKINHDSLEEASGDIRTALNRERERHGLDHVERNDFKRRVRRLYDYFGELDFVAFSFYPDMRMSRPDSWWRSPATADQVSEIAGGFDAKLRRLAHQMYNVAPLAVGEFGIGCTDPARPYDFVKESFLSPDGGMDAGAAELRRKYYLGFLEALRRSDMSIFPPVTFWTVGQYDVLGTLGQPGYEAFRDETLREAIAGYNRDNIVT